MQNGNRMELTCSTEPAYNEIKKFWPPVNNPLAFLSWPDHLFKFTLLWNGGLMTVVGEMSLFCQKYLGAAACEAMHLSAGFGQRPTFACWPQWDLKKQPSAPEGEFPIYRLDHDLPGGGRVRQEIFSLCPAGKLKYGNEPLVAWMKFTVLQSPPLKSFLWLQIAKGAFAYKLDREFTVALPSRAEPYPHSLVLKKNVLYSAGQVRLAILPEGSRSRLIKSCLRNVPADTRKHGLDHDLVQISLPAEQESLEICIPFLPLPVGQFRRIAGRGYAGAQAELKVFYRRLQQDSAQIIVPNSDLTRLYRAAEMPVWANIQRNPYRRDRERVMLTSPVHYEAVWATPNMMAIHDLDRRGYHSIAADLMEPYRKVQGRVNAPSPFCIFPEGLLQDPPEYALTGAQWLSDHGAIMWASAEHYLLTRDADFYRKWCRPWNLACQWIANNRVPPGKSHTHVPAEYQLPMAYMPGLMWPGQATDDSVYKHFIFSDGWLYKGLITVVRALAAGGDRALAQRWQAEAADYYRAFRLHFDYAVAHASTWSEGRKKWPLIPSALPLATNDASIRDIIKLDTGPLFLGFAELVGPAEPAMTAALRYYTHGPDTDKWTNRRVGRVSVLVHEMSSWEVIYSWSMFLRLGRGEREKYVEGLYSQFTGGLIPQTAFPFESRHGVIGLTGIQGWFLQQALVWMPSLREMRLLAGCPREWLENGKTIVVKQLPTYAGVINFEISVEQEEIHIHWSCEEKRELKTLRVYLPGHKVDELQVKQPAGGKIIKEKDFLLLPAHGSAGKIVLVKSRLRKDYQ